MRIAEQLPPFVATVAVCVNEPVERLREYLEFVDWVQLHGEESGEVCQEVGRRAIKAFRLAPGFQVNTMTEYPAAAYLVDAYQKGARGGTGTVLRLAICKRGRCPGAADHSGRRSDAGERGPSHPGGPPIRGGHGRRGRECVGKEGP